MTGPGAGKLLLKADVFLAGKKIVARVYIHVKGYSLARVTHLDIESPKLNLMKKKGDFLGVLGIKNGMEIPNVKIKILCNLLNKVLREGERTRTWVGQKVDGIYIGFRKVEIEKLEKIAGKNFGFEA